MIILKYFPKSLYQFSLPSGVVPIPLPSHKGSGQVTEPLLAGETYLTVVFIVSEVLTEGILWGLNSVGYRFLYAVLVISQIQHQQAK